MRKNLLIVFSVMLLLLGIVANCPSLRGNNQRQSPVLVVSEGGGQSGQRLLKRLPAS